MTKIAFVFFSLVLFWAIESHADSFGSGVNAFDIEFVTVGNPGNAADTTGNPNPAGSVGYAYRLGKYEISTDIVNKVNAEGGLGIPVDARPANKPATSVSWYDAARFVNWLNTSTGSHAAYKFSGAAFALWQPGDAGYDAGNLFRNSLANYVLPSSNEWYKAAYYDPASGAYFDFPTGSNSDPTPVASGTAAGTAVYNQSGNIPADVTLAGGLSPYGTMAQGGNEFEWEETEFDLINDSTTADRGYRGGSAGSAGDGMDSLHRNAAFMGFGSTGITFRVVSTLVPEPSSAALLLLCVIFSSGVSFRRRKLVASFAKFT